MTQRTACSSQEFIDFRWQKTNYSLFFENTEMEALAEEFGSMIDQCNRFFEDNLDWWSPTDNTEVVLLLHSSS